MRRETIWQWNYDSSFLLSIITEPHPIPQLTLMDSTRKSPLFPADEMEMAEVGLWECGLGIMGAR